jgi:hypothetical protein
MRIAARIAVTERARVLTGHGVLPTPPAAASTPLAWLVDASRSARTPGRGGRADGEGAAGAGRAVTGTAAGAGDRLSLGMGSFVPRP